MPSPLPRQDRGNGFARCCSLDIGLPQITVGSAPALSVSWPAQRSLALRPTDSPSRLMRPSTSEAPTALLSPPPLRLLPGGAIQFPGGPYSRCGSAPSHGALQNPNYTQNGRLRVSRVRRVAEGLILGVADSFFVVGSAQPVRAVASKVICRLTSLRFLPGFFAT